MADIEKIIEGLNLPKQILEKSEALLKTLFGPSFEELGGMIADQVRMRRYTNQIKIFSKAQEKLSQHKINPKKVSLKVLAPLIEYSSLEEDENLQIKWANLTCHILGGNKDEIFQQNCISILNKITSDEAKLLDKLHALLEKRKIELHKSQVERYQNAINGKHNSRNVNPPVDIDKYSVSIFEFYVIKTANDFGIPISEFEFSISNFITLGLLKWETHVSVDAEKASDDPEDQEIDVNVNVDNSESFTFTSIGDKFIKVCKG